MLYHAFPDAMPGGFIGVDVFFVISGYLITQLMLREIERSGQVDLRAFWARRIRRILPAATIVLIATALAAAILSSADTRLLGRHIIAASLFYYNWRQAGSTVDYLAQDDVDNPLMHYWSLSLEEQFYLVWPPLVAAVALTGSLNARNRLLRVAIALLGASFAYSLYLTESDGAVAFFSTFTRSWQLLAGAAVAMLVRSARVGRLPLEIVSGLAAAALGIAFFAIDKSVPYPGIAATVPTLATATLIYCGGLSRTWTSKALSAPPAQLVGRVSYSWYLWHWPVLVLLAPIFVGAHYDPPAAAILAIAISFLLAVATFRWIETPLRNSALLKSSLRSTYLVGAVLIAIGVAVGLGMKHFGPDSVSLGDGRWVSRSAALKDLPRIYDDRCLLHFEDIEQPPCVYGAPAGTRTVILFGDSHAANWFVPLHAAAANRGWKVLVRTKASCRPLDAPPSHTSGAPYRECEQWRVNVLREIELVRPDVVIVASAGAASLESESTIFESVAAVSRNLVIMRDTPRLAEPPLNCLARNIDAQQCAWPLKDSLPSKLYPQSKDADLPANAAIKDFNARICPGGICHAVTGGMLLMGDNQHFTASFAATLTDEFEVLLSDLEVRN